MDWFVHVLITGTFMHLTDTDRFQILSLRGDEYICHIPVQVSSNNILSVQPRHLYTDKPVTLDDGTVTIKVFLFVERRVKCFLSETTLPLAAARRTTQCESQADDRRTGQIAENTAASEYCHGV